MTNEAMSTTTPTFSIRRELDAMPEDVRRVYEERLAELDVCMRHTTPYTVRDDSRLAFRFVGGELPTWSPWMVTHEMACAQFLCDALPYQSASQPFLRALATRLKHESGLDWKPVWAAVAELGPEILKLHLMCEHGPHGLYFPIFEGPTTGA